MALALARYLPGGRRVAGHRLIPVGRVPLGKRSAGGRIRRHLRVGGHRLPHGTDVVNVRVVPYRMLANLHDADDALQETLLRAWKALPRYEPRGALSTWLHRIATNVALRMIEQRGRDGGSIAHLQPYPDRSLDELASPDPSPEARAIARAEAGLAYTAALQLLPPKQRAVLVLRDALDWSARETAELLGDSPAAVNSALQRARERIAREQERGTLMASHATGGGVKRPS